MYAKWWAAALVLTAACTKKNPGHCGSNSDCSGATPFCDVEGAYDESDHTPNTCTPIPADCPIDVCGCTPGTALSCDGDQLTSCAADGTSTTKSSCVLGCATGSARCATFTPSNGLAGALKRAADEGDVAIPKGSTIDTDTGAVRDSAGESIPVTNLLVGPIRVFIAKNLTVDAARVLGAAPIALVASGAISIQGFLDISGKATQGGPGAQTSGSCTGLDSVVTLSGSPAEYTGSGPSGAGHATTGGTGGGKNAPGPAGGAGFASFTPLRGGCQGGNARAQDGTLVASGGGGGGAIQIVAGESLVFSARGFIAAGGGGGAKSGGGGSGGTILLEAPTVAFSDGTSGAETNGGGGGCQDGAGQDALPSAVPAKGCSTGSGDGGTGTLAPIGGYYCGSGGNFCIVYSIYPGGGGSAGSMSVSTLSGGYDAGMAVLSTNIVTSSLTLD